VAADSKVSVTLVSQTGPDGKVTPLVTVPPSALLPEVVKAMEKTLKETWPGVPLVATMSAGASDGKFTRIAGIPTFGLLACFLNWAIIARTEKMSAPECRIFYDGVGFNYKLIRAVSSAK